MHKITQQFNFKYMTKIAAYSLLEMLLSLLILSIIIGITSSFIHQSNKSIKGQALATDALYLAKVYNRYLTSQVSLFTPLLESAPTKFIVVPISLLKSAGYLLNSYPNLNRLHQVPCLVVKIYNGQLQAVLYYRKTATSSSLSSAEINASIGNIGAVAGYYANGQVLSVGKDWGIKDNTLFSNSDLSPGSSTSYQCQGTAIAENSLVLNLAKIYDLNSQLAANSSLDQYNDNNALNPDTILDANTITKPLIMDSSYTSAAKYQQKNSLVFQINPNLPPLADPGTTATQKANYQANSKQQLSIATESQDGAINVTITGFKLNLQQNYVGQLRSRTLQATLPKSPLSSCLASEIGKIVAQPVDASLNSIHRSLLQCEKNPLCGALPNGICYLPLHPVSLYLTPNQASATCPAGTFIVKFSTTINQLPFDFYNGVSQCCLFKNKTQCENYNDAHNYSGGSASFSAYLNESSYGTLLPISVTISPRIYYKTCDPLCNCAAQTLAGTVQAVISSMTCTNDIGQAHLTSAV